MFYRLNKRYIFHILDCQDGFMVVVSAELVRGRKGDAACGITPCVTFEVI